MPMSNLKPQEQQTVNDMKSEIPNQINDHTITEALENFKQWCHSSDSNQIDRWASEYQETDMVVFENFGSKKLFDCIHREASHLLHVEGERRDLNMKQTGDTPRKYISVGRDIIHRHNGLIPKLFESSELRNLFSQITNSDVHPVDYTPEQYIINRQESTGDTHGWHCDDYQWAFIWVMDAPQPSSGGRVEYIPRVVFDPSHPLKSLEDILRVRESRSKWLPSGAAYLMRANRTLHRVTPLTKDQTRTVVVMTFASEEDNDREIDHTTMQILYPNETLSANGE